MDSDVGFVFVMLELRTLRRWIIAELKTAGFEGRASRWVRRQSEIVWMVTINTPPHRRRLAVDLGLFFEPVESPETERFRPVVLAVQFLPTVDLYEFRRAFDLEYKMDDEERRAEVEKIIRAMIGYADGFRTVDDARAAYRRSELENMFMHWAAREFLESDSRDWHGIPDPPEWLK